jgi:hypothetical protein
MLRHAAKVGVKSTAADAGQSGVEGALKGALKAGLKAAAQWRCGDVSGQEVVKQVLEAAVEEFKSGAAGTVAGKALMLVAASTPGAGPLLAVVNTAVETYNEISELREFGEALVQLIDPHGTGVCLVSGLHNAKGSCMMWYCCA